MSLPSHIEFRVVSVEPTSQPIVKDGNPPVVQTVRITAMAGTGTWATLAWQEPVASDMSRVGGKFIAHMQPQ